MGLREVAKKCSKRWPQYSVAAAPAQSDLGPGTWSVGGRFQFRFLFRVHSGNAANPHLLHRLAETSVADQYADSVPLQI